MTTIKEYIASKDFKLIIYIILGIGIALIIFQVGVFVGYRKATFSYRWGDNYSQAFGRSGGRGMPMMGGVPFDRPFSDAHGVAGKIISITLPQIVVESVDNTEQTITVTDTTAVLRFRDKITVQDLKIDDMIVVIGNPTDSGIVDARLIRILPDNTMVPPPFQDKTKINNR